MKRDIRLLLFLVCGFSLGCQARMSNRVILKNKMNVPVLVRYVALSSAKWRKFEQRSEVLFSGESIKLYFPKGYKRREWIAIDGPGRELLGTIKTDKKCISTKKMSKKCTRKTKVIITGTGLLIE
jgi:hypothetical protein